MGACVSNNRKKKSKKVPENDKKYQKNPNQHMKHEIRRKLSKAPSVSSLFEESELEIILSLQTEAEEKQKAEADQNGIVDEPEIQEIIEHKVNSSVTLPLADSPNEKPLTLETQDCPKPLAIEEEPPTPQHLSPKEKIRFRRDFFLKDILDPPSSNSYQTNLRNSEVVLRNDSNSFNEHIYLKRETYPLSKETPAKPKRKSLGQSSSTTSDNLNKEAISLELEESENKMVDNIEGEENAKKSEDKLVGNIDGKKEARESEDEIVNNIAEKEEATIVEEKVLSSAMLDEKLANEIVQNDIKSYAEAIIIGKVTGKINDIDGGVKSVAAPINNNVNVKDE